MTWTGPFWNDELSNLRKDYLLSSEALLLGRVTYEGFAAAWPTMEGTGEFGERMNAMPKYVASRTLGEAEWNATILEGDLVAEVAGLKEQPGQDLLIHGSADLVDELSQHGLIDESPARDHSCTDMPTPNSSSSSRDRRRSPTARPSRSYRAGTP